MTPFQYLLLALLLIHLLLAAFSIVKTFKTTLLSKNQKIYNTILIIVVPFIWSILIYYILRSEPLSYEIEEKNDVSSNNFYESGTGQPGSRF